MRRRVGIVGLGNLGQYLMTSILNSKDFELAFVWNRTKPILDRRLDPDLVLDDLSAFGGRNPDLIIEVAHPSITEMYGELFLDHCDYMIGSPTALADQALEQRLKGAALRHGLYVPSGAFWGGEDIRKMADSGILERLKITMKKHPSSLKLEGELEKSKSEVKDSAVVLYEGPVRGLCAFAPRNTNTMAAAAIAAHNLGFDAVQGCLVADPSLKNYHIVEIEAWGSPKPDGSYFHSHTVRKNPANIGEEHRVKDQAYISVSTKIIATFRQFCHGNLHLTDDDIPDFR